MEFKNDEQKTSYALGLNMAMQVMQMPLDFDKEAFFAGCLDMFDNQKPQITQQEFTGLLETLFAKIEEQHRNHHCDCGCDGDCGSGCHGGKCGDGAEHAKKGDDYRAENAKKPGVQVDGKVFASSVERGQPIDFPLNQVIAGWTEGLQLLKVGGKAILTIPPELGYGSAGAGNVIPPNATLVFEVELLDVL